jgi:WD40 repeat protein
MTTPTSFPMSQPNVETPAARRSQTRNRGIVTLGVLALLMALVAGYLGWLSNQNAILADHHAATAIAAQGEAQSTAVAAQAAAATDHARAEAQTRIAFARQLVIQAQSIVASGNNDRTIADLLAVQSMKLFPSVDAARVLLPLLHGPREVSRMFHGTSAGVNAVAFSPDGKYVVSGSDYGIVCVWEAATGKEVARMTHVDDVYKYEEVDVRAVAFTPDGTYVVSGSEDNTARVWEAATGKEVARMTYDASRMTVGPNYGTSVGTVAVSPDGKFVVSGGCDHVDHEYHCTQASARVWVAATGQEVSRMTHEDQVIALAFSPDGKYVVSSGGKTAMMWEAANGQEVTRMTYGNSVRSVAISLDGKFVVSSYDDGTARVWEAATGREIARMTNGNGVGSVAFSPDGKYVVSGGGKIARVWEAATGQEVSRMTHEDRVIALAFSPDGKYVVSSDYGGNHDGTTRVWESATGQEVARMLHAANVWAVAFSPDGKYVVSGDYEGTAHVWDLSNSLPGLNGGTGNADVSTGQEVSRMTQGDWVLSTAFSPDGKFVVSGSTDKTARVWEAATGREVSRMTHGDWVLSVAFSPDGKYVASGSDDKTARVWETATGLEVARVTYGVGRVNAIAFSPDGKYVASSGCDIWDDKKGCTQGTVRMWVAATGLEVSRITHDQRVSSIAFSPDGNYVVSGGCEQLENYYDCTQSSARVWAAATGQEVARMTHGNWVSSVAFSPDGKYVVSGGGCEHFDDHHVCDQGGTARVWEAATGREIARMTHAHEVRAVAFSPDGKFVVSGGCDRWQSSSIQDRCVQGTARVWVAATGQEISRMTYDSEVWVAAFNPDGKYVVSGGCDHWQTNNDRCTQGSARVWEAATGQEVARMTHEDWVNAVAFSPDGKYVVSSGGKTAMVWLYRPEDFIALACARLPRNLSPEEWAKYIGNVPYEKVCEHLP